MSGTWRRPLWLLFGIPLLAALMLFQRYWSDYNFDRSLPIDRDLAGTIIGVVVVLGFLWFADDRNPRSADQGSDFLADRYDWVPMAIAVAIIAALAGTIGATAIEDLLKLEAFRFIRQHVIEISTCLLMVTGAYWLLDTFRRKTSNRAEFVISRTLATTLLAVAGAGYFVLDRAHLTIDPTHLSLPQYLWIATTALVASIVLLRK